jgi:hypothetical protein
MKAFTFEFTGNIEQVSFREDWEEFRQLNCFPVVHFEFFGNTFRAWTDSAILSEDGFRKALGPVLRRQGCALV